MVTVSCQVFHFPTCRFIAVLGVLSKKEDADA